MVVRLRPTLPHRLQCSTIGAERLSFRVRNGTGRFPFAITAVTLWKYVPPPRGGVPVSRELHSGREQSISSLRNTKVVCVSSHRLISTSQLHTLPCFHIWPINPVVWLGASRPKAWKSHLEAGFPLRCFQRLSIPNVANQRCTWQYNWHTRGSSNPVLSY